MKKLHILEIIFVLFVLAGCGGQEQTASIPTIPTITSIPIFVFNPPTEAPSVVAVGTAVNATFNEQAVERGRGRYEALECAACHGENGAGVEEQGPALVTSTLSEEAFISFMRSGGAIGAAHQYSTNRLSDSGGRNLYQYLVSIRE